ncbi:MAG: hypothetical protein EBW98_05750 [Actinobacteria bacterium]|nr:hypothetical protein [Actinomycetota bacterium]
MWDAAKHPDAKTIADIAAEVSAISVFGDRPFMRYLVGEGVVPADKVDGNYKGNLLLTTDDVAHQGFATSEPYRYLNLDSGAISVAYQLLHDTGWTSYPQNLAINKLRLDALRGCLTKLVPMMQHAQLDYIAAPQRTNAIIIAAVKAFDTFWTQDESLTAFGFGCSAPTVVAVSAGVVASVATSSFEHEATMSSAAAMEPARRNVRADIMRSRIELAGFVTVCATGRR